MFLESKPEEAILSCVDLGNSLRMEALGVGEQQDGRSLGF